MAKCAAGRRRAKRQHTDHFPPKYDSLAIQFRCGGLSGSHKDAHLFSFQLYGVPLIWGRCKAFLLSPP